MSDAQQRMFGEDAGDTPGAHQKLQERRKDSDPRYDITRAKLRTSLKACYALEDAIWSALVQRGADERTSAERLRSMFRAIRRCPPASVAPDAWTRMIDSMQAWSVSSGSLEVYRSLRNKRHAEDAGALLVSDEIDALQDDDSTQQEDEDDDT